MTVGQNLIQASNRFYLRIRHPDAFKAAHDAARAKDFGVMDGASYCLLTTFKRSGEPVPTPVWFGVADGKLYFHTEGEIGKIKRIRNEGRVLVGPCTMRGKPKGPMVEARARVLPHEDEERAEAAIQSNYGLGRRIYEHGGERLVDIPMVYVEVMPV
jgi:PPOX class probable F420-dependent enzyme